MKGKIQVAEKKKLVSEITSMDVDFAQWYTDIVKKAEMADYSSVKGCIIMRPYAQALWENIQHTLDGMFKETGHENVAMPIFIPESLLQKEADHVEGFAPECAWVTHGGNDKLEERLCVRPTSETLFCEHYAKIVRSWRDLPKLYNQWCSVVRWEKTTRPFLRSREFWWQEGHTVHATAEEAMEETLRMLNIYAKFFEEWLAIPVVKGEKTEKERFAGAENTYTIEAMMHDCKALQSGTSHYFGDGFARAFGMQYTDKNNTLQYMYQTSWGVSTRMIGAIIMTHGDNEGLVLPPRIAPTQLVVIPAAGIRAKIDLSDNTPGWKFAEYEMKGIPLRLEVGPRDIAEGQCVLVRRDTREKTVVKFEDLEKTIPALLEDIQKSLYEKALANREAHTYTAKSLDEMKSILAEHTGFIKSMWCGDLACEEKVKEETGMPSRCMPFEQEHIADTCPVCGKPANKMVVWGIAY